MPTYYCTATDLQSRISSTGYNLRVDDDATAVTPCLQRAKNTILFYAEPLYGATDLQTNANAAGWVNDKATDIALYHLCARRGNPVPASIKEDYQQAMQELALVHDDNAHIPELAQRHTDAPTFSNIRVDPTFNYRKIRVERTLSDQTTPTGYTQTPDWRNLYSFEI